MLHLLRRGRKLFTHHHTLLTQHEEHGGGGSGEDGLEPVTFRLSGNAHWHLSHSCRLSMKSGCDAYGFVVRDQCEDVWMGFVSVV